MGRLSNAMVFRFTEPTPIQEAVIIPALRDRLDILGAAETVLLTNCFLVFKSRDRVKR